MKNKIIMALVSVMLLVSLSACDEKTSGYVSGGTKEDTSTEKNIEKEDVIDENKEKEEVEVKEKEEENVKQEDKKTTQTIKVYFSDDQAENLVEKQIDIDLAEGETLEMKVLESLKSNPEDETMYNAVEEHIKFNGVKVEERVAKVDISSQQLQGSSTQETFLKDAVVAALTSLDTVDGVKFLLDGQETDTLMGHLDVSEVLTKDSIQTTIVK